MAEKAESPKMISLKTVEGDIFEASTSIIKEMQTLQSFINDDSSIASSGSVIPLLNVHTFELSKIIEYYDYHHRFRKGKFVATTTVNDEAKEFNIQFVKQLSDDKLKELMLACNFLNAKELLNLLSQSVANHIQNKSVEFVRNYFGLVSDFLPEEEEKIREDSAWAFQGVDED